MTYAAGVALTSPTVNILTIPDIASKSKTGPGRSSADLGTAGAEGRDGFVRKILQPL